MTKYIWFTIILIVAVLALAVKQAPHEPEIERPQPDVVEDTTNTENGSAASEIPTTDDASKQDAFSVPTN